MGDPLDDKIKKRIKEVFDNYEDTGADEGWLLLREKFPAGQAKRRGPALLWWSSVAAAILIFIGIGLWIKNERVNSALLTVKPVKGLNGPASTHIEADPDPNSPARNRILATDNNKPGVIVKPTATKASTNNKAVSLHGVKVSDISTATNALAGSNRKASKFGNEQVYRENAGQSLKKYDSLAGQSIVVNNKAQKSKTATQITTVPTVDASAVTSNPIASNQPSALAKSQPSVMADKPTQPTGKKQQASINNMFTNDKDVPKVMDKLYTDKKVRFAVYAATYFNYAKGSNNQVNVGAGVSSDIRLSKNLKLVTGISIAQNTLNYSSEGAIPVAVVQQNFAASAAVTPATSIMLAAKPQLEAAPTFKSYNANLVGLDVPVNLKYEFNPDKSDTYVSAGLSSGTFINEAYTYNYIYPSASAQTDAQTDRKSFNNFYFAKTFNFAFGVGYPVGKNNTLVIEPFLKYPLDGLGAQQIRFGAGGVNLKLNFKAFKK